MRTGHRLSKLTMNAGAGILLLLYIAFYSIPHGLVPHSDHEHLSQSGHVDENDPCHQAIYHPGSENSCDHKYHFTKDPEKCPLCDVVLLRQILIADTSFPQPGISFAPILVQEVESFIFHFPLSHSDRGPPSRPAQS